MENKKARISRALLGIVTTVLVILATFFAWRYVSLTIDDERSKTYEREIENVIREANSRVNFMSDLLYSLRGTISVGEMTSKKWTNYFTSTNVEDRYPEYFSFAFVDVVQKGDIHKYVSEVKKVEHGNSAYESFFVFPKTENAQSYPVRSLYTHDPDIQLLLGYDVGSSPAVSKSLIESVRTGNVSLSDLTFLKLLIPSSDKSGYVMALPVYSEPRALETVELRSKKLVGFVGIWVDKSKLFGNLESPMINENAALKYDVYDGSTLIRKDIDEGVKGVVEKDVVLVNKHYKFIFSGSEGYRLSYFQENLPFFTLLIGLMIIVMWYGTLISILSSRRRAEEMAEEATKDLRKFKQAVEGVSDHVIITDPEGVIVYANKAAAAITGYSIKEMMGQRPSLWGGQMPESYYRKMWKIIKEDKKPFEGMLNNKRKLGEIYEAEISISPILNTKNELIYFVGIERDITRAKALDKMKTEFISLASHQLRTPLSAVKWFGSMLLSGDAGKLTKTQEEYINKINSSNEREIQLVNALLNISRIESGRITITPKLTNMEQLVEQIVSDVGVSEGKHIRNVEIKVEKDLPLINIDPDLIRQAYMNLLTNAIRYSKEDGRIKVELKKKGKFLLSSVTDNGIGIPGADQNRIFERFFRAVNAMKLETDGSGLGLYLTKTIIQSSGGKIWFKSQVGRGTTFFFTLPLSGMKPKKGELTLA